MATPVETLADRADKSLSAVQVALTDARQCLADLRKAARELEKTIQVIANSAAQQRERGPSAMKTYDVAGVPMTLTEMAARAGCSKEAMNMRLRSGMAPAAAIAAGSRMASRAPHVGKYLWEGKPASVAQLAAIAGCTKSAMTQRLRTLKLTPEQAVAKGGNLGNGPRRPSAPTSAAAPAPAQLTTPQPRPGIGEIMQREAQAALRIPGSAKPGVRTPEPLSLPKDAELVVPVGVKRTVCPAPRGPYDVDPADLQGGFASMRPGQYLDNDNALARAYGSKKP